MHSRSGVEYLKNLVNIVNDATICLRKNAESPLDDVAECQLVQLPAR